MTSEVGEEGDLLSKAGDWGRGLVKPEGSAFHRAAIRNCRETARLRVFANVQKG